MDKSEKKGSWPLIALFLVLFLGIGGQSAELTCERIELGGPVTCSNQTKLLWIIPLGTNEIDDVRGASLADTYDAEYCNPCYRVELLTDQGSVPLTTVYTSGYSSKQDAADRINTFVGGVSEGPVVVTEPGLLSAENLLCFLVWVPIALALGHLWKAIKSPFSRSKPGIS